MKAVVDNWCKDDVTGESSQPPVSGGASRSQKQQSVAAKQLDGQAGGGGQLYPLGVFSGFQLSFSHVTT